MFSLFLSHSLDISICSFRNQLELYTSNIESLTNTQNQLRSTRDTNVKNVKNVTLIMKKCIQLLRKKLNDKNVVGQESSMIKDHDDTCTQTNPCDIIIHNDDDRKKHARVEAAVLVDGECSEDAQLLLPYHEVDMVENENEPTNLTTKPMQQPFIFEQPVQIKSIENDIEYMKKIWSQNHPSNCPMYQHSTLLKNPLFPLHPPIGCPTKLERVINICQYENLLRRQEIIRNGNKELLERDYRRGIEGTCLDIYACSQYDPFYVSLLPNILKASAYEDESENDDDDDDFDIDKNGKNKSSQNNDESRKNMDDDAKGDMKPHPRIDANTIICRYDLLGSCKDPSCPYQHLNINPRVKRVVHKKGSNKLTVNMKKSSSKRTARTHDFVVHLPSLNLPPLPSIQAQGILRTSIEEDVSDDDIANDKQILEKKNDNDDAVIKEKSYSDDPFQEKSHSIGSDQGSNQNPDSIIENSKGIKRKFDEISEQKFDDSEDDFIGLPDAFCSDDDSEDEETDIKESEAESQMEKNDLPLELCDANDIVEPVHLYEALSMFKFEVREEDIVDKRLEQTEGCFEILYKASSFDERRDKTLRLNQNLISPLMDILQLLSNTADAIRLCVFSGRVDICRAIIEVGEIILAEKGDLLSNCCPSESTNYIKDFITLAKLIVSDIQNFADGYFCGRGSISYINDFHVQLGLTMISYFIRSYHQAILAQDEFILSNIDMKLFVRKYKRFTALALGMKYDFNNVSRSESRESRNLFSFPNHLLPKEMTRTNFASLESTPKTRLVKVFESFYAGQKLASYFASFLYCSDRFDDPQLILDEILHPLIDTMQSYVISSKSSVAADVIDNALHGESSSIHSSVGLPTQLCIFAIFGPSVFASFAGIFISMKKKKCEKNGNSLDSRQQGILWAAKNLIMTYIQLFDQSGIAGETFEGQLLLSPMFSMMANILANIGSYSKTQVLLENTLYASAGSTTVWSVYSESLWSSLIQLRMCFPLQSNLNTHTKYSASSAKLLAQRPLLYGLNLAKVNLDGDSSLLESAMFFRPGCFISNDKKERKKNLNDLRDACSILVTGTVKNLKTKEVAVHMKIVYENCLKLSYQRFPYSILLAGERIERLSVLCARLKNLPLSLGKYLVNLKVCLIQ